MRGLQLNSKHIKTVSRPDGDKHHPEQIQTHQPVCVCVELCQVVCLLAFLLTYLPTLEGLLLVVRTFNAAPHKPFGIIIYKLRLGQCCFTLPRCYHYCFLFLNIGLLCRHWVCDVLKERDANKDRLVTAVFQMFSFNWTFILYVHTFTT